MSVNISMQFFLLTRAVTFLGKVSEFCDGSPVGLLPAGIGMMTPSGAVGLIFRCRPTGLFAICTAPIVFASSFPRYLEGRRGDFSAQGKLSPVGLYVLERNKPNARGS